MAQSGKVAPTFIVLSNLIYYLTNACCTARKIVPNAVVVKCDEEGILKSVREVIEGK